MGMRALVNEALRLARGNAGKRAAAGAFAVQPHSLGFKPQIDLDRINQLADELEAGEAARKLRSSSRSTSSC